MTPQQEHFDDEMHHRNNTMFNMTKFKDETSSSSRSKRSGRRNNNTTGTCRGRRTRTRKSERHVKKDRKDIDYYNREEED